METGQAPMGVAVGNRRLGKFIYGPIMYWIDKMALENGTRSIPELERMRNLCYQEGKAYLDEHPDSRTLYQGLKEECPHLSRRELVELFHLEDEELVRAAAHRLEYNACHPGPPAASMEENGQEFLPL